MSDFDEWWYSEFDDDPNNMTGEMYRECWNAARAALIGEVESLRAELAEEKAIVNRIWEQLGAPSYAELAGRSIYDLIDEHCTAVHKPLFTAEAIAALVGEVEPVAFMCQGNIYNMDDIDEHCTAVHKPLFTAEALATAHAKGREDGLREAAALCLETRIKHPYQPAQEACYLAILRLLEKKP